MLDESIEGDEYLDFLRAEIYLAAGDYSTAFQKAKACIAAYPDLQGPYWTLLNIALNTDNHLATLQSLKQLDRDFHVKWGDLTRDESFTSFAQSPQHIEWLDYLRTR